MKDRSLLLIAIIAVLLFSCSPKKNMIYMSNNNFEQAVSQARYEGLKIQEGDLLDINVSAFDDIAVKPFNKATMQQTGSISEQGSTSGSVVNSYQVDTNGQIVMPVLGHVFVKGLTKQQVKEDIENRLKPYLTEPSVTVNLLNFNFFVLGDVGGQGQKSSSTEKLNILQAIAIAGGANDSSNLTNVKLVRYSEEKGKDVVIPLDLSEASIVNSPYYYIQQNDIIYVEPDKNKQIAANNTNTNRALIIQLVSAGLGLLGLIIGLTR